MYVSPLTTLFLSANWSRNVYFSDRVHLFLIQLWIVVVRWQHFANTGMPEHTRTHHPIILQKCCQPQNRPACITVTVLGFVIAAILLAFLAFGQDESSHATLRLVSVVSDNRWLCLKLIGTKTLILNPIMNNTVIVRRFGSAVCFMSFKLSHLNTEPKLRDEIIITITRMM
jgi:hypothetical protein